jgi:hypothetical protein
MIRSLIVALIAGAAVLACTSETQKPTTVVATSQPPCANPTVHPQADSCAGKTMAGQRSQGAVLRNL